MLLQLRPELNTDYVEKTKVFGCYRDAYRTQLSHETILISAKYHRLRAYVDNGGRYESSAAMSFNFSINSQSSGVTSCSLREKSTTRV